MHNAQLLRAHRAIPLLFAALVTPAALAQVTSLSMTSDPGDYIGGGATYFFTPADGSFGVQVGSDQSVQVSFHTPSYDHWWYLNFVAANGAALSNGSYLNAQRWPFETAGTPGLSVYGDGRGCNTLTGDFQVLQIQLDSNNNVTAFDARFDQHCEGMTPALHGEIRYNANVPLYLTAPTNETVVTNYNTMFSITATDAQSLPVTLSATGLPPGATFVDLHNNTASFRWTPLSSQTGAWTTTFLGVDTAGNQATVTTQFNVIPPPPANDDVGQATVIPSYPHTVSEDATTATVAPTDPWCYGAAQTVWFKYTATSNVRLEANTFGSNYDTTLSVYTGTPPSGLTQLACNDDSNGTLQSKAIFDALGGTTYYFMVSSLYNPVPQAGLVFNLIQGPPPFAMVPAVQQFGSVVNSTGTVTISGTVTCNESAYVSLNGQVKELKQKQPVSGFFNTYLPCNGVTPWSATVVPDGIARGHGRSLLMFGSGKADVGIQAYGTDPDTGEFKNVNITAVIQLRGK